MSVAGSGLAPAAARLQRLMDLDDPYALGQSDVGDLQWHALQERFETCREAIPILGRRAADVGIERPASYQDLLPLLFAHQTYKSYPDAFVVKGRWEWMNLWLQTLSTHEVLVDVDGVADTDGWIEQLREHGHHVAVSSGTSGKTSFLNRTAWDRRMLAQNTVKAMALTLGIETTNDRPVFLLGPQHGAHDFVEVMRGIGDRFGRPGDVHWLSLPPLSEAENRRQGQLRTRVAEGRATPSELAGLIEAMAERQQQSRAAMATMVERIAEHQGEPSVIAGFWLPHFMLMEQAREFGMADGALHPDTGILVGGGAKGADLPSDYREQVERFHGLGPSRYFRVYGMMEMSTPFFCCSAERYHCPPWIRMLILDRAGEKLLTPADDGTIEGRLAFFDTAIEGRWGGIISGDKVTAHLSPCACGRRSPSVSTITRYTDIGDDKLTCGGTMSSYIRGVIGDSDAGTAQ